ncbi:hypothetical protein SAY87_000705 [Trapa incisa]|uniref:Uncharacterized protein n=1 Tax=Trapa incisa TaxID=236973 RepID=A0AAN7JGE0_9MYRT|nr:hypothetical protein SAY87_000705 [Trapa incisa]
MGTPTGASLGWAVGGVDESTMADERHCRFIGKLLREVKKKMEQRKALSRADQLGQTEQEATLRSKEAEEGPITGRLERRGVRRLQLDNAVEGCHRLLSSRACDLIYPNETKRNVPVFCMLLTGSGLGRVI